MQPGHIHLLIFLLGLALLAAFAWLAAWLSGFPEWAKTMIVIATGLFAFVTFVLVGTLAAEAFANFALGPMFAADDRGGKVEMRAVWDDLGRDDRGVVKAVFMRVVQPRQLVWPMLTTLVLFGAIWLVGYMSTRNASFVYQMSAQIVVLFLIMAVSQRVFGRLNRIWTARAIVFVGRCGGCGYSLRGLPPEDDGCRVCPECGAAWKLGA